VLLDEHGRARVTDFGLAMAVGLERLTQSGTLLGTPQYMAPEQMEAKREAYGPPTDVWALGVMLYELLTDQLPFEADSMLGLYGAILESDPAPPRSHDATIPRAVEAVCLKALQRNSSERYADASALARDLRSARSGGPVSARPRSRGGQAVGISVLVLAGVGVVASSAWPGAPPVASTRPATLTPPEHTPSPHPIDVTLQHLERGDLEGAFHALRGLDDAPPLERLERARELVLAADVGLDRTLGDELPSLEALARLAQLRPDCSWTPPGAPQFTSRVARTAAAAITAGDASEDAVRAIELLARARLRMADRLAGADLLDAPFRAEGVQLDPGAVFRLIVAGAVLDLDVSYSALNQVRRQPAARGPTPWHDYVRLRGRARSGRDHLEDLAALLADPPPGLELGPRQRAEALISAIRKQDPAQQLPGLLEARQLDPESLWVLRRLALAWSGTGQHARAKEALGRAERLFVAQGWRERVLVDWEEGTLWAERVRVLAAAGDRKLARETFHQQRGSDREASLELLEDFEWLDRD
jgi:hypothetical protein